jgi:hypothetical protein
LLLCGVPAALGFLGKPALNIILDAAPQNFAGAAFAVALELARIQKLIDFLATNFSVAIVSFTLAIIGRPTLTIGLIASTRLVGIGCVPFVLAYSTEQQRTAACK